MAKYTDETTSKLVINMFESDEQYQNLETVPENELCLTPDDTPERLTELEAKVAANTSAITTKTTKSTDFKTPITNTNKGITEADVATLDDVNDSVMDKTHTYSSDKISSIAIETDIHSNKRIFLQIKGNRGPNASSNTRLYLYCVGVQDSWFVINGSYDSSLDMTKYDAWGAGMFNWRRAYLVDKTFANENVCKASPANILRYWQNYNDIDDYNTDNASTWSSNLISETINERISDATGNYLPLTGGTLSGNLNFERPDSTATQWNATNYTVNGYKWSWQYNHSSSFTRVILYFNTGNVNSTYHIFGASSYEIKATNATLGGQSNPFVKVYAKSLITFANDTTYTITVPEKTGTIALVEDIPVFSEYQGATETTPGVSGLVPASEAGANTRFLNADGTWKEVIIPSAERQEIDLSDQLDGTKLEFTLSEDIGNDYDVYYNGLHLRETKNFTINNNILTLTITAPETGEDLLVVYRR